MEDKFRERLAREDLRSRFENIMINRIQDYVSKYGVYPTTIVARDFYKTLGATKYMDMVIVYSKSEKIEHVEVF